MSAQTAISLKPDSYWNYLVLRQELRELEREKIHLDSKALERPLNDFENNRRRELLNELMELLPRFGSLQERISPYRAHS